MIILYKKLLDINFRWDKKINENKEKTREENFEEETKESKEAKNFSFTSILELNQKSPQTCLIKVNEIETNNERILNNIKAKKLQKKQQKKYSIIKRMGEKSSKEGCQNFCAKCNVF